MRKNIAVLFGGCSPEYSVSLQSAHSVITHINTQLYRPVLIGISQDGNWYLYCGAVKKIAENTWCNPTDCLPAAFSPNRGAHTLLVFHPERVEKIRIDAAFPVLHGKNGEDGTVQGLLELAGIPIVGCGAEASAICMDKYRAHRLAADAGIAVPDSFVLTRADEFEDTAKKASALGYPLFVKPVRAGSSYGITRVTNPDMFFDAVHTAFTYDDEVVAEEQISGFEVGCAVMGNDTLITGEVDEIELLGGFFNFTEKYTLKTSAIHVPARILNEKANEIKQTAKRIYRALGCAGFARVDLFLQPDGKIVFNEVNTIPGFTAHSRFPNMMKAAGISFEEVISLAIEAAITPETPKKKVHL